MFELSPYHKSKNSLSYNPFREMEELERHFFGEPFAGFFRNADLAEFKTDLTDEGDSYLLEADLPGFDKNDIHLDVSGNTLTINAQRRSEHEQKDKKNKYVHLERSYGSYSRAFDVSAVDTDNIKAKYENGVLKLTMPKKEQTLPESRQLEIE